MSFTYGKMTYASNAAEPFFEFLQDMIAAGWRVRGSGNYTSYENYGVTDGTTGTGAGGQYDLITSVSALTQKVLNTGTSWIRMATPSDAPIYREFLFYTQFRGSVVHTAWRIEWARDGYMFDTGAAAGTPPTATRAVAMGSRQPVRQNSANDCSTYAAPAGENWYAWTIGDIDENYDFMFWSWKNRTTTPGAVYSMFGSVFVADTWPGLGTDNDPFLYFNVMRTSDGTPAYSDMLSLYDTAPSVSVRQESSTSQTIAPGVYASQRLSDYSDNVKFGTWQVGLLRGAGDIGGTTTWTQQSVDLSDSTNLDTYDNTELSAWIDGFSAAAVHATEAVRFPKGYCSSNMLKLGPVDLSGYLGQPYLVKDVISGQYYANFQGICIAWEALEGIPV